MSNSSARTRAYTITELIVVITIIGILVGAVALYISSSVSSARVNTMAKNADQLTTAAVNLSAAGAIWSQGAYSVSNGSASTSASVSLPAVATPAAVSSFASDLAQGNIVSNGHRPTLSKTLTPASYTYVWTNGLPVFSVVPGATNP